MRLLRYYILAYATLLFCCLLIAAPHSTLAQTNIDAHIIDSDPSNTRDTFTPGPSGTRLVGIYMTGKNLPANSLFRVQYYKPNQTTPVVDFTDSWNKTVYPDWYAWYVWWVKLDEWGTWKIKVTINNNVSFTRDFHVAYITTSDSRQSVTQFSTGLRSVGLTWDTGYLPANSKYSFIYERPGSVPGQYEKVAENILDLHNPEYSSSWWWYFWSVNLNKPGSWRLTLKLNGTPVLVTNFDVVQSPSSVVVDDTRGYDVLEADANVDNSALPPPLLCSMTPRAETFDLLFQDLRRMKIWLSVESVRPANGAKLLQPDLSTTGLLAYYNLIAPSLSPTYKANFNSVGSSVTLRVGFNRDAATLTLLEVLSNYLSTKADGPHPVSPDQVIEAMGDIRKLSTLYKAASELNEGLTNKAKLFSAITKAAFDLAKMGESEMKILLKVIKEISGVSLDLNFVKNVFKPANIISAVKDLVDTTLDLVVFDVALFRAQDSALEVRFTAQ